MEGLVATITSRTPAPLDTRSSNRSICSASGPTPSSGGSRPPLLHDTQQRRVAPRVAADGAGAVVAQVAARGADLHLVAHPADRLRQPAGGLRGLLQQVEGEPLGRFPPDTGELGELRGQLVNRGHWARARGMLTAAAGTEAAVRR